MIKGRKMFARDDYRSIVCLNGTLPDASFFKGDLPVVAADGAANTLMAMGIRPAMVIGDLDSIHPEYLSILPHHYHEDQNACDFEKTLMYLENAGLLPAIVVGVSGGHLDHILNNVNIFIGTNNLLYAPPFIGFCLSQGARRTLSQQPGTNISILGIPHAVISSCGLKWELNDYALTFPGKTSCFNRSVSGEVQLFVKSGSVLVLINNTDLAISCP